MLPTTTGAVSRGVCKVLLSCRKVLLLINCLQIYGLVAAKNNTLARKFVTPITPTKEPLTEKTSEHAVLAVLTKTASLEDRSVDSKTYIRRISSVAPTTTAVTSLETSSAYSDVWTLEQNRTQRWEYFAPGMNRKHADLSVAFYKKVGSLAAKSQ